MLRRKLCSADGASAITLTNSFEVKQHLAVIKTVEKDLIEDVTSKDTKCAHPTYMLDSWNLSV